MCTSFRILVFHIKIHLLYITHAQMLDLLSLWPYSDFSSMGVRGGCLTGTSVFWSGMGLFVVLIAGVDLLQIADWHKLKTYINSRILCILSQLYFIKYRYVQNMCTYITESSFRGRTGKSNRLALFWPKVWYSRLANITKSVH